MINQQQAIIFDPKIKKYLKFKWNIKKILINMHDSSIKFYVKHMFQIFRVSFVCSTDNESKIEMKRFKNCSRISIKKLVVSFNTDCSVKLNTFVSLLFRTWTSYMKHSIILFSILVFIDGTNSYCNIVMTIE